MPYPLLCSKMWGVANTDASEGVFFRPRIQAPFEFKLFHSTFDQGPCSRLWHSSAL